MKIDDPGFDMANSDTRKEIWAEYTNSSRWKDTNHPHSKNGFHVAFKNGVDKLLAAKSKRDLSK
jgi:hypothetical protein